MGDFEQFGKSLDRESDRFPLGYDLLKVTGDRKESSVGGTPGRVRKRKLQRQTFVNSANSFDERIFEADRCSDLVPQADEGLPGGLELFRENRPAIGNVELLSETDFYAIGSFCGTQIFDLRVELDESNELKNAPGRGSLGGSSLVPFLILADGPSKKGLLSALRHGRLAWT